MVYWLVTPANVRGFLFFAEKFGGLKNRCIFETSNKPKNTVMTVQENMTFDQFREARIEWSKTRPSYEQNIESDFEGMTKFIYEKFYLTGKLF